MSLETHIEGILFYASEPLTLTELSRICKTDIADIETALQKLVDTLAGRGIALVRAGDTIALMTSPLIAETIERMRKEELKKDIGKAGAETLAIIAYHGTATRSEIDFIRGVNSTFILRNLLIRGLIERIQNPHDQRSFVYRPTTALYAHLGITRKEELPQYADMMEEIARYRNTEQQQEPASP